MDQDKLTQLWHQWETPELRSPVALRNSGSTLGTLIKNIRMGYGWLTLISVVYVVIAININHWQAYVGLMVMLVFHGLIVIPMIKIHTKVLDVDYAQPIRIHIKALIQLFDKWYILQYWLTWLFMPVATILGGVLGAYAADRENFSSEILMGPLGLILVLIAVPTTVAGHFLFRFLYRHSYGKHIAVLKSLVEDMEKL
jgi:hypothetical protein